MKYLDYKEVFSDTLIREIDTVQEDSREPLLQHQNNMIKKVEEWCSKILKEVTQVLEETKNKAKQFLEEQVSQENLKTLKAAVDQQYHTFFSKDPSSLDDKDFQNYIASYIENELQLENEIVWYETVIQETMKMLEVLEGGYQQKLESIKKILNDDLDTISVEDWCWENSNKSNNITLSNNNLVAINKSGGERQMVVGNKLFTQGKYSWEVTINAVDWIYFGIMVINGTATPSNYCVSSDGCTLSKHEDNWRRHRSGNFNNKTFKCKLNTKKGTFQIKDRSNGNVVLSVQDADLKNKLIIHFATLQGFNEKVIFRPLKSVEFIY